MGKSPFPGRKVQAKVAMERGAARTTHDQLRASKEDGNHRQFAESPASNDNKSLRATGNQPSHQHDSGLGSNSGRPSRQNAGREHSIEKSPVLQPHYEAKARKSGGGSPAPIEKNSYDSSHGSTPGRRLQPVLPADERPHKDASVPKFGEWDENNPQSADAYTHIFNKVREERLMQKPDSDNELKGGCFPFFKKSFKRSVVSQPKPRPEEFGISTSDALNRNL